MDYWNHNVHYQPVILESVPPGCGVALDVGCGDGMLACKLAARCAEVTGIDRDTRMITLARERAKASALANVEFVETDFRAYPLNEDSFDFVCANTSLHHMDFAAALTELARVLRPGGHLAVVGLAADKSPGDYLIAAAGFPCTHFYRMTRRTARPGGFPVMDPDMSWREVYTTAQRILPGVRYRRHLLWRYSLRWRKPA